jgi:VanZ family protein
MERLIRWLPAVVWMGIIFYLSHQSGDDLGSLLPLFQKIAPYMVSFNWGHFIAYFILACTFYFALGPRFSHWKGKLLVILFCFIYGVTDEYHQSFIPNRHPDWTDLRNDTIGALLAMLILSFPPFHRIYLKLYSKKY